MKNKPIVRSLADVDTAYSAAAALVAKLRTSAAELDKAEADLLQRLANHPATVEKTANVSRLLGEDVPDDDVAPSGIRARLKEFAGERVDIRAALDIATQRLTAARFAASKTICAEVAPAYTARVRALAGAMVTAFAAHQDLKMLIDSLNAEDVAWSSLNPMNADRIFGAGQLTAWFRDAISGGFVPATDVPKELRA